MSPGGTTRVVDLISVGTSPNAVEAERAVHVSILPGLEQVKLTSTVLLVALDAVVCRTGTAYGRTSNSYLARRRQGLDEMELPDRAEVLAEARSPGHPGCGNIDLDSFLRGCYAG